MLILHCVRKKHFSASQVFRLIQEETGKDYEGEFNEIYCPPQTGSVEFWIPDSKIDFDEQEECEKMVCQTLLTAGDCVEGEFICLDFDY